MSFDYYCHDYYDDSTYGFSSSKEELNTTIITRLNHRHHHSEGFFI